MRGKQQGLVIVILSYLPYRGPTKNSSAHERKRSICTSISSDHDRNNPLRINWRIVRVCRRNPETNNEGLNKDLTGKQ